MAAAAVMMRQHVSPCVRLGPRPELLTFSSRLMAADICLLSRAHVFGSGGMDGVVGGGGEETGGETVGGVHLGPRPLLASKGHGATPPFILIMEPAETASYSTALRLRQAARRLPSPPTAAAPSARRVLL